MDISEVHKIAQLVAQETLQRVDRYMVEYQAPETIEIGLAQSMGEELTATSWYRRRAINARLKGDEKTARLYEDIANDEEGDHYVRFGNRLKEIADVEESARAAAG